MKIKRFAAVLVLLLMMLNGSVAMAGVSSFLPKVTITFTRPAPKPVPKTADSTPVVLAGSLLVLSAGTFVLVKRHHGKKTNS